MRDAYLLRAFYDSPWAIVPEKLAAIEHVLRRHAAGLTLKASELRAMHEQRDTDHELSELLPLSAAAGQTVGARSIAVLNLFGTIGQRMDMLMYYSGGTSTEAFMKRFREALHAEDVDSILIRVDSPGGTVYGVQEAADEIFAARGTKPVVAVADSLCASAAYWIASAADEVVATPGADVGSIGVYVIHTEFSEADKVAGVKSTLVKAGRFKAEFNDVEPLADEARDHLQEAVDQTYKRFVGAVARHRGAKPAEVREGYGEGRVLTASAALAAKLIDRVATFEETVARLRKGRGRSTSASKSALAIERARIGV